jgi:alpha-glucosidase
MNQPKVHDVYRRWRAIAREYQPERLLLGETWVSDLDELGRYYGRDDELQLAMNFPFVLADFDAGELREIVERSQRAYPDDAWPVWCGSNHDVVRFTTRWCGGDEQKIRCALLVLLTLRGTPILYYGDELLLEQVELPREALCDPVGVTFWPELEGRDGSRTPMPWAPGDGHGFTARGVEPWLPFGDRDGRSVDEQRADERSPLHLARDLIALRRREADLRTGVFERLQAPDGGWAFRRGDRHAVALNLAGERPVEVPVAGSIVLSTSREREGEQVDALTLAPAEGAVLALEPR